MDQAARGFQRIEYLEWAKARYGRVRFDLATNGRPAIRVAATLANDESERKTESGPTALDAIGAAETAVAKWVGARPEEVAIAPGTSGALFAVAAAIAGPDVRVAVERPTYEPLWRVFEAVAATIDWFPRPRDDGYQPDVEAIEKALQRGARVVVLSNLHNPSGVAIDPAREDEVVRLAARFGATVVVDEVFLDLVDVPRRSHRLGENVVACSSLTKAYGLGALRFGWVAATEAIATRAREVMSYTVGALPIPMVEAGTTFLAQIDRHHREAVAAAARSAGLFRAAAARWGWSISPTQGTFALVDLPQGVEDRAFVDRLIATRETIVAPGSYFFAPRQIRVSAVSANAEEGLERLATAIIAGCES